MARSCRMLALLALALFCSAAHAEEAAKKAAKEPMLLGDFMYNAKPSSKASAASYKQETHSVTFDILNRKDCRFIGNALTGIWPFDSDLACKEERHPRDYAHDSFQAFTRSTAGTCQFTRYFYDRSVNQTGPDGGVIERTGTFTARCTFNENAEECAGPLCDGATVVASGNMYRVYNVLVKQPPTIPPRDSGCLIPFRTADGGASLPFEDEAERSAGGAKAATASAKGASPQYGDDLELNTYYSGVSRIWFGTIDSITTPKHSIPVTGGYIQVIRSWVTEEDLIPPFNPPAPVPYTGSLENKLIVDPYTVTLKLQEPASEKY